MSPKKRGADAGFGVSEMNETQNSTSESRSVLRQMEAQDAASVSHEAVINDEDHNTTMISNIASTTNVEVIEQSNSHATMNETHQTIMIDPKIVPWWYDRYEEVWLSSVLSTTYCSEEKRMPALLLHIKKNEMNRSVSIYSARGGRSNVNFGTNDTSYDRIFLFGCLGTDECFVILSKSARKSRFLLEAFTDKGLSVGQTVFLLEPTFASKGLGTNNALPILDVNKRLEPFSFRHIPTVSYQIPAEPGTRYFLLQGVRINIMTPVMQRANCGGYLCDRQILQTNEKSCCCLFNSVQTSLVLQVSVTVTEQNGSDIMYVETFRSWILTKLFISGLNLASKLEDFQNQNEMVMRSAIHKIVNHINTNGGWYVFGWMRRGTQIDAAEKGAKGGGEDITAENVSPHIIRMVPSTVSIESLSDMMFKKKMIHVE